jgi:serine/threonine protein kinase
VGGKGHGKGVDWWTLGILIFEMLASYTPFYHEDHMKMYQKITKGRINFPAHFSPVGLLVIIIIIIIVNAMRWLTDGMPC